MASVRYLFSPLYYYLYSRQLFWEGTDTTDAVYRSTESSGFKAQRRPSAVVLSRSAVVAADKKGFGLPRTGRLYTWFYYMTSYNTYL